MGDGGSYVEGQEKKLNLTGTRREPVRMKTELQYPRNCSHRGRHGARSWDNEHSYRERTAPGLRTNFVILSRARLWEERLWAAIRISWDGRSSWEGGEPHVIGVDGPPRVSVFIDQNASVDPLPPHWMMISRKHGELFGPAISCRQLGGVRQARTDPGAAPASRRYECFKSHVGRLFPGVPANWNAKMQSVCAAARKTAWLPGGVRDS